tara:strand:- start:2 stop:319 length:318 start_codon:yes stop_codon:yes gene_type:complete
MTPFLVFLFIDFSVYSQTVIDIKFLPKKINETSGLEYLNGNFITHNDSGGKEKLYEFSKDGKIISEHYIMIVEKITIGKISLQIPIISTLQILETILVIEITLIF